MNWIAGYKEFFVSVFSSPAVAGVFVGSDDILEKHKAPKSKVVVELLQNILSGRIVQGYSENYCF